MLNGLDFTHTASEITRLTPTQRVNAEIAIEISADEITPIAFSRARFFTNPTYGLFVELAEDGVIYTIRKYVKARSKHGYADVIEQDSCYESIFDIWSIYAGN